MADSEEIKLIGKLKLGVVSPACNSSTEEAEVGGLVKIQSQPGLHSKTVLKEKRKWGKKPFI